MPTITRTQVQAQLSNREINVDELKARTDVPADVKNAMAGADANADGVISGTAEVDALFKAADNFDRNGDRNSVATESRGLPTPAAQGLQAAVATSKPKRGLSGSTDPNRSISRADVQAAMQGKEVKVSDLQSNSELSASTKSKLAAADSNRDGVISGAAEVDRAFNAIDDLDGNGDRDSVNAAAATAAATALTAAA